MLFLRRLVVFTCLYMTGVAIALFFSNTADAATYTIYVCTSGEAVHAQPYTGCANNSQLESDTVSTGFTTVCSVGGVVGGNQNECTQFLYWDVELLQAGDLVPTTTGNLYDAADITFGFGDVGEEEEPPDDGGDVDSWLPEITGEQAMQLWGSLALLWTLAYVGVILRRAIEKR